MNLRLKHRPGYTLLELLIAILIFSGIVVLAIAAFARSINSAAKSGTVRNQVQAARTVIDQLSNDLHYIDTTDQVASFSSACGSASAFIGVRLGTPPGCDEIELLLKYPGATGAGDLVWRRYTAQTLNTRPSIYVYELRGCSVVNNAVSCPGVLGSPADLVASSYVIGNVGSLSPIFSGTDFLTAKNASVSPAIKIRFDLKPAANLAQACSALAAGNCYTLDTTVIPGAI